MILSRGIKMLGGGLVLIGKGRMAEWSLCWTRAANCSTPGGHLSVQDQYLPPQFSSLADLYNCLCGLERLNQRSYFTPFFLLVVSRGRGQKRAVCVCVLISSISYKSGCLHEPLCCHCTAGRLRETSCTALMAQRGLGGWEMFEFRLLYLLSR